ncbi:MAG: four helix bundle protein, partial [Bacteroidetes bacterium]|nr:four helix bundle protein [Bacteroidota bacterium]
MATIKKFEEIEAWKKSRVLANQIFDLSRNTELKKDFALRDQLNRSIGSIMDNIAEGFERGGKKEFMHFLY